MEPKLMQPVSITVDMELMAMKGYSIFSKSPGQQPHHQMNVSVITKIFVGRVSLLHRCPVNESTAPDGKYRMKNTMLKQEIFLNITGKA